jgi:hypothetical protein
MYRPAFYARLYSASLAFSLFASPHVALVLPDSWDMLRGEHDGEGFARLYDARLTVAATCDL